MSLTQILSLVILISFAATVVLALASYAAYKFRERRRPRTEIRSEAAPIWFERVPPPDAPAA